MKILILLRVHLEEYLTIERNILLLLYTEFGVVGDAQKGGHARPSHSSTALW